MRVTLKFTADEEAAIVKLAGGKTPYSVLKSIISAHIAGTEITSAAPLPEVKADPGQQDLMALLLSEFADSRRSRAALEKQFAQSQAHIKALIGSQNAILANQRKLDAAVGALQKELSA